MDCADRVGSDVVCYGMNTITNAVGGTWDNYLARLAILIIGGSWVAGSILTAAQGWAVAL